jgi:hypothetical protein
LALTLTFDWTSSDEHQTHHKVSRVGQADSCKLLYPASQLRTDIAFAVGYLARAMSNPTDLHHQYALQVLDYLYTTKDLVMRFATLVGDLSFDVYSKTTNLGLHAYSDASFADAEDRKST